MDEPFGACLLRILYVPCVFEGILFVKIAPGVSLDIKNNKEQAFHSSDHTRQTHIPARDICRLLNFVGAACQNFGEEFLSR